jgi:hypothetical protein
LLSLHTSFFSSHTHATQPEMSSSAFHLHIFLYSRILFVKHKQIHMKLSSVTYANFLVSCIFAKQLQKMK